MSRGAIEEEAIEGFAPVPLQSGWIAWQAPDGGIILQFRKQVLNTETGHIIDMENPSPKDLPYLNSEKLLVRSIYLSTDGSAHIDHSGVSFAGMPGEKSFQILDEPGSIFMRFMANPPSDLNG